jgi:hypothetical protein
VSDLAHAANASPLPPVKEDEAQEIHPVMFFSDAEGGQALDADFSPIVQKVKPTGGQRNPDGSAVGPVSAPPTVPAEGGGDAVLESTAEPEAAAVEADTADTSAAEAATPSGPAPD